MIPLVPKKCVYAFDVDETLDIARGPIPVSAIKQLYDAGHIVGLCGNWHFFVKTVPDWNRMVSFVGQVEQTKTTFLTQIKKHVQADAYIMVGNDPAFYGNSNDILAAKEAGWIFYRECDFDVSKHLSAI